MLKFSYTYTKWVLLALIILAGVIRFIGFNTLSLNFDEQILWFIGSQKTFIEAIELIIHYKPASPLLGLTAWLTNSNAFQIEFISRLGSFLSGIVSVPLMFFLTRKFYSEIESLIAAGFVTFSWVLINTSQTLSEHAIMFSLILFYFLSLISFLDRIAVEHTVKKIDSLLLISSGILLGFSSIYGIITVSITFLYSFFFIKKINTLFKTLFHIIIILIPLAAFVWFLFRYTNVFYIGNTDIIEYLFGINFVLANNYVLSLFIIFPLFFLFYIYIKRLIFPAKFGADSRTKFSNSTLFLTIWIVGIIAGLVLAVHFLKIRFCYTDLIFLLPPIIILISRGIVLLSPKLNRQIIFGAIFMVFIITSTLFNLEEINNKSDYNQATRYIMRKHLKNKNEKYGVVFSGIADKPAPIKANMFYIKKNHINLPVFSFDGEPKNINKIINYAKERGLVSLWYICDENITSDSFLKTLKNETHAVDGFRYKKISLILIDL